MIVFHINAFQFYHGSELHGGLLKKTHGPYIVMFWFSVLLRGLRDFFPKSPGNANGSGPGINF